MRVYEEVESSEEKGATSMDPISLCELRAKESGIVEAFKAGDTRLVYRLRELGLVAGTKVLVKRFAPLGDPIEIQFRGYCISIRKKDAKHILVKKV